MLQGFASAYYQCDPRSSGFLEPRFTRVDERRGAVETARARRIAPALLRAIQEQNEALGPSVARAHQLEKLTQPGAAVVVTGQQLGLFLGPLYTVYKALTAVEWAKRLEAETGHPVVPVFWLQTEDHDFDEVAVFRAAEAAGALEEIRLPKRSGRRSISSLAHDDAIEAALEVLRRGLEGLPEGEREFERFRSNYASGRPWVDSFTQTMAEYFQDEGLVFLNPRCAEVAELAAPIHARAVEESDVVGGLLLNRAKELESKGFKVQVPIRPECTLSFYHPDGNSGDRFRLRPGGGDFELAGRAGSVSSSEVRKTLDTDPLCFSSSALLRPIVQDTLLPTAAYVGGPGEISYFAELEPLYGHFEVPMPMIVPRRHFAVVGSALTRALNHVGLGPEEATPENLDRVALEQMKVDPEWLHSRLRDALESELAAVEHKLLEIDKGLARPLEQTRKTVGFALEKLSTRVGSAQMRSDTTLQARIERIRDELYPFGAPQERILGCPSFFARYGVEGFKSALRSASDVPAGERAVVAPVPIPTGGAL